MTADAALVLARTLHITAILQLAGIALALAVLPIPARAWAGLRRLGWAGLVVAAASGGAWMLLQSTRMSGEALTTQTLATVLSETQFGHSFALRAVLLAGMPGLLAGARWRWLAVLIGALAAATLAWSGHGAAGEGLAGQIQLAADTVHLLAAAAWLGGLLPLVLVLRHGDTKACILAAKRFSRLGVAAVAAVAVSGLGNGYFLVGSLAGLLGTPYGYLLLIKLALFAAMLAIAAINRHILTPRLAMSRGPLIRNIFAEATLAAVLLAAVGALGIMVPAVHGEIRWPLPYRLDGGLVVPATPMSFARAPIAMTAEAVARGQRTYGQSCAGCHPGAPQTSNHGDIYWWAAEGHGTPPLPAAEAWDMVHYLSARALSSTPLSPDIAPGMPAPDFDYETTDGQQGSLTGEAVTLLVFYDDSPLSQARLNQLAVEQDGRRVLAIPLHSPAKPHLSVSVPPEVMEAFRVALPDLHSHTEVLVDGSGRMRARSHPGQGLDWHQMNALSGEADPG